MRRHPLTSSVVRSVGYDAETAVLEIEFTSGDVYRYYAVPPSAHRALTEAESPGAYFNRHISDRYPTRQQYDH
ncbi:KTSC domain-containing protein [Microbacterium sp. W1N]|uniref:KTSC domain-containing protein n=1 Tax=Microbacterium festucae TaxID=2977531 RepID=UPI0021BFBBA0|nr:KTSC domain-containing protein [Microbacterium festucae]MCT9819509.1 KTSC domain-containing protein [Microbacterium festucae]